MSGPTHAALGGTGAAAGAAQPAANWSAVLAMSLGVFALIASEFMPVSLLTPVAADLRVSEGMAGQAISVSGAFALLTSLAMTRIAGRLDRKVLLLCTTLLMVVSSAVAATASSYVPYMVGRVFIGVSIGGFWSLSAATAMRLVPLDRVPRALAIFNGGNALATIIAAPLGSYLGSIMGWRGAFFCLVPVAAMALVWQWISLPAMPAPQRNRQAPGSIGLLRRPAVALGMAAAGLFFMGQFTLFTYVRPFLETVTNVDAPILSWILLGTGVTGFIGTSLIGTLLRTGLFRPLVAIPVLMAGIAAGLIASGRSTPAAAALLAAWGLLATAAPVGWWTWVAQTMSGEAEVGGALMVAVVQLSIALGSTVGGLVYDAAGFEATFAVAMGVLLASAGVAALAARAAVRRHT